MLRIQQSLIQFKGNIGTATPAIQMLQETPLIEIPTSGNLNIDVKHEGFSPNVSLKNISYKYPTGSKNALSDINLQIGSGKTIAIVGASGAGKTTLIDALLGVLPIESGTVEISGLHPIQSFSKWPGAVAYVPQNVVIVNSTIKENIILGYNESAVDDSLIWDALEIADLTQLVKSFPMGLNAEAGENGSNLSGGQRQRLGIARAFLTKPKLIVLDEATSSLDGESEAAITDSLLRYHGDTTIVTIAHRLSTVRNADQVVYMRDGKIECVGTFDEVRTSITDFDSQARLMGL
jgi:ABC-type bacteriocin/lantibiotic exporter with double-glycine peptidase domain